MTNVIPVQFGKLKAFAPTPLQEGEGTGIGADKHDQAETEQTRNGPQIPQISLTAALQVVAALTFYARAGFDHGAAARKALTGMNTVIASQQT